MSERIDNVAEALDAISGAWDARNWPTDGSARALAHATLALVEQQRIANLIALANFRYQTLEEANSVSNRAFDTLFNSSPDPASPGNVQWLPSPDIAAALGVES